jgi:CRISPR-associated endoribonuclease Cas6
MRRVDLILEKCDTKDLHPALAAKLQAALMRRIPSELAEAFHKEDLRPYSLFVTEQSDRMLLRLSALSDEADPLLDAALRIERFSVSGTAHGLKALDRISHPIVDFRTLTEMSPIRDCQLVLASPATYRQKQSYRCLFDFAPLFFTVADKLKKFSQFHIENHRIEEIFKAVDIRKYYLQSERYEIKHGSGATGCIGRLSVCLRGSKEENGELSLLLRYAAYSGLGAKTALGMGGFVLLEE